MAEDLAKKKRIRGGHRMSVYEAHTSGRNCVSGRTRHLEAVNVEDDAF